MFAAVPRRSLLCVLALALGAAQARANDYN